MDRTSELNAQEYPVSIPAGSVMLDGNLWLPKTARGVVLFAHGSNSSQNSVRNRYIAQVMRQAKLATLLINLLTPEEKAIDRQLNHLQFDIGLLVERLLDTTNWLLQHPTTQNLGIGYLTTSTGSAAALMAATEHPEAVGAIASYSGRPDLAGSALSRVRTPTLLIVGGNDIGAIELNQDALEYLHTEKQLESIPGATRLVEEADAVEEVARLASQWFERYLTSVPQRG